MECSFLGLQLVVRPPPGDSFHAEMRDIIGDVKAPRLALAQKRVQYTRAANLLAEAVSVAEFGYWDFIPDPTRAETEYETWCSEIESGAADPAPRSGPPSPYCIVSVGLLAVRGSNSDQTLGERCDIPEGRFWTPNTFRHLALTLRMVNFATIAADSIYLVPGEPGAGPTLEELRGEGFEYLHPLG